jgi:hypothetical protein
MRIGDLLDAYIGYRENENEQLKNHAEILRISTSLLWNVHVPPEDKLSSSDLWPLPWDENKGMKAEILSEEERLKRQQAQEEYLNKMFPENG